MFSATFEFKGVELESGVSNQASGNTETFKGALNRAKDAQSKITNARYRVGIKGGIEKVNNEVEAFAWVVVISENITGKARTSTFFLPQKLVELIEAGMEMGKASDILFNKTNSKHKGGTIGVLTEDVITRTGYYQKL
jgi:inosine/xanthosine triphosphatase